jgi:hypothetical protein
MFRHGTPAVRTFDEDLFVPSSVLAIGGSSAVSVRRIFPRGIIVSKHGSGGVSTAESQSRFRSATEGSISRGAIRNALDGYSDVTENKQ